MLHIRGNAGETRLALASLAALTTRLRITASPVLDFAIQGLNIDRYRSLSLCCSVRAHYPDHLATCAAKSDIVSPVLY